MDEATIRSRLEALRTELGRGDQMLVDLDRRRATVRDQMLRVQGAAQVLEELLEAAAAPDADAADDARTLMTAAR